MRRRTTPRGPGSRAQGGRGRGSGSGSGASCVLVVLSLVVLGLGFRLVARKRADVTGQAVPGPGWDAKLPQSLRQLYGQQEALLSGTPPELWLPVDLSFPPTAGAGPLVTLCRFSGAALQAHAADPSRAPMAKDLTKLHCSQSGQTRRVDLAVAAAEAEKRAADAGRGPLRDPTGFVFHESRVGSTLVANMLASVPRFLVWSESRPPANALLHCRGCSAATHAKVLRQVLRLMCDSPYHTACFFKFQSATVPSMELLLRAFPETPYVFLFRNPLQTLMSHMTSRRTNGGAPCLRSKSQPPQALQTIFQSTMGRPIHGAKVEEHCAAHLAYLSSAALAQLEDGDGASRGVALEYTALPEAFINSVMPGHFSTALGRGAEARMRAAAASYSKARGPAKTWKDDSATKEAAASPAETLAAGTILQPSYERLRGIAERHQALMEARAAAVRPAHRKASERAGAGPHVAGLIEASAGRVGGHPKAWAPPAAWSGEAVPRDFRGTGAAPRPWALGPRGEVSRTGESVSLDAVDCPPTPAPGYPRHYPILNVTSNWPPDDTRLPVTHHGALCRFDYQTERAQCEAYRNAEVPFVVYNVPSVEATVSKWSDFGYLSKRLKDQLFRTEASMDNHFMYWSQPRRGQGGGLRGVAVGWQPPTSIKKMTFDTWMKHALEGEDPEKVLNSQHYYFRMGDVEAPWIRHEDVTIFRGEPNLFMKDPRGQRGIHCRFGMRGVIAESHFDSSRNFVAQLGGARRWIMSEPGECENMYLLPPKHPSGRHSEVDWSEPDLARFPKFRQLRGFDVVVQAGDVLYVPAYWFHYIVSLGINYQCNSRSGKSDVGAQDIRDCGFAA